MWLFIPWGPAVWRLSFRLKSRSGKGPGATGEAGERSEIADNYSTMGALASETGGEMIRNTNDLSKAIADAIKNGSHYYTLSYVPSNQNMDGQFRRIEVKTPEPKYSLSYRRGYYAIDSAQPLVSQKDSPKRNRRRPRQLPIRCRP